MKSRSVDGAHFSVRLLMSLHDAVDGSSPRHLGAMMVAVEATIERGADHERYYNDRTIRPHDVRAVEA
jgi:hypothetical protein